MKFDYSFERENYEKFLKMTNNKSNYICIILFSIFYFITVFDLISKNFLSVLISYLVSVLILYSILKLISTIFVNMILKRNDKVLDYAYGTYHINITKDSIKEEVQDRKFEVKFIDIARISKNKKYLIIYPKEEKIMYIFLKDGFKEYSKYEECKNLVLNSYNKVKENKITDNKTIEKDDSKKNIEKEKTKKDSNDKKKNSNKKNNKTKKDSKK